MKKALLVANLLFGAIMMSGCANPYREFYTDLTGGKNVRENPDLFLIPTTDPKFIQGQNPETDTKKMLENGYAHLGFSFFNAGEINQYDAWAHAKKIHADSVFVYSEYTNTLSGMTPMVLPDTQTSYHSGSIYTSRGGSANYLGSSTTYGSTTTYIPYHVRRYDYLATFWVKLKQMELGIYYEDLTDELRKEVGSNKGVRIAVVVKGTPAFKNDLLVDDVIRRLNDIEIADSLHLERLIDENRQRQIKLEIFRNAKTIIKYIQLN